MTLNHSNKITSKHAWIVAGILLISLTLRAILIVRGGQFYFSDESRYQASRDAALLLIHGEPAQALMRLFASPEHLGFKIIGLIPAAVEAILGASNALPALFFSLFSVGNLFLIYRLAGNVGFSPNRSILALLFAASSHSLLYYSRHLMPYDIALFFGLLALYAGLDEKPTKPTSLACGILASLCFMTYNGYWTFAGFAMLAHLFFNSKRDLTFLRKSFLTALGFILPVLLLYFLARAFQINLFAEYGKFARSISQGEFGEGWSLPIQYLWSAEHLVIVIFGGLSLYAIAGLFKNNGQKHEIIWAGGLLFIYLCLVVFSVFLHTFVVYGRLVRQMMPFLILLSVTGLGSIMQHSITGAKVAWLLVAMVIVQFGWNFATSYELSYPREFVVRARADFPDFEFSEKRLAFGAPAVCRYNGYMIENVKYFLTPPDSTLPEDGQLLMSAQHPVNFLPYQYEGYPLAERQAFRELKLQMKFYKAYAEFMSAENPAWTSIKSCVVKEK
jgi:hypothetical protein